jgi:hypothetical protein
MAKSMAKYFFLHRERVVLDALLRQIGLLDCSNKQLAQKSIEEADLLTLCLEHRDEATTTQWEVAPLVEKVRLLEENL